MDARELRIGNLFIYNDTVYSVSEITEEGVNNISEIAGQTYRTLLEFEYDKITPIPLTEEWLKRFGFVNEASVFCAKYEAPLHYLIHKNWGGTFKIRNIYTGKEVEISKEIKHVHVLQNLYFALTNKELEYER